MLKNNKISHVWVCLPREAVETILKWGEFLEKSGQYLPKDIQWLEYWRGCKYFVDSAPAPYTQVDTDIH